MTFILYRSYLINKVINEAAAAFNALKEVIVSEKTKQNKTGHLLR